MHHQFQLLCHQLKIFGGERVARDGTQLAAVNARSAVDAKRKFNVAKPDTSAHSALGLYAKKDFAYDTEKDLYCRPAGAELTHRCNTCELVRALAASTHARRSGSRRR